MIRFRIKKIMLKFLRLLGFRQHQGRLLYTNILSSEHSEFVHIYICTECGQMAIARVNAVGMSKAKFPAFRCKGKDSMYNPWYLEWVTKKLADRQEKLFKVRMPEPEWIKKLENSNFYADKLGLLYPYVDKIINEVRE